MKEVTAEYLRDLVADAIAKSIDIHRGSRQQQIEGDDYGQPVGPPTEEEIDDFLCSNSLLDIEVIEQLVDPGLLGFSSNKIQVSKDWLEEFKNNLREWASTNAWLGADMPWLYFVPDRKPSSTEIWTPDEYKHPKWFEMSPSCLLLAADLIRSGKLLSEMNWREFEKLIGVLLEKEGWKITITQATRDGGIDVVATKLDETVGEIKSVWQAKKYGPSNLVRLRDVRELSAIREEERASKALIVTTSRLTRDAIEWVKRDIYRLGYKEHEQLERWIKGVVFGKER